MRRYLAFMVGYHEIAWWPELLWLLEREVKHTQKMYGVQGWPELKASIPTHSGYRLIFAWPEEVDR